MHTPKHTGSQKRPLAAILDLNLSAFQLLGGVEPELHLDGTRVTFLFDPTNQFYQLTSAYNSNAQVAVLDYVSAQRRLRAQMLALRGSR